MILQRPTMYEMLNIRRKTPVNFSTFGYLLLGSQPE